jgi:MoxR-like ATPase
VASRDELVRARRQSRSAHRRRLKEHRPGGARDAQAGGLPDARAAVADRVWGVASGEYLAGAGVAAKAFLEGRSYTIPDDVKALAHDVLRHRIVTTYEAEAQELTTDDLIDRVLDGVEVP